MDLYSILGQQLSVHEALPPEPAPETALSWSTETLPAHSFLPDPAPSHSQLIEAVPGSAPGNPAPGNPASAEAEEDVLALRLRAEAKLAAILSCVVERVRYITNASGVALALCEGEEEAMVCHASSGPSAPEVGARMFIRSGITAESMRTRQTLRCDRASTDPRVNHESCQALGIESVMVMPLIFAQKSAAQNSGAQSSGARNSERNTERNVVGMFELFGAKPSAFAERDANTLRASVPQVESALRDAVAAGMTLGRIPWAEEVSGLGETTEASVTLRTPVAFPIDAFRKPEVEESKEPDVPAFLARLADEARPAGSRTWSHWFRPQW